MFVFFVLFIMSIMEMCMYVFVYFQISRENITDFDWNVFVKSGLKYVMIFFFWMLLILKLTDWLTCILTS